MKYFVLCLLPILGIYAGSTELCMDRGELFIRWEKIEEPYRIKSILPKESIVDLLLEEKEGKIHISHSQGKESAKIFLTLPLGSGDCFFKLKAGCIHLQSLGKQVSFFSELEIRVESGWIRSSIPSMLPQSLSWKGARIHKSSSTNDRSRLEILLEAGYIDLVS